MAIRGEDNIRDEMTMAMKTFLWDSIVGFIAGEFPNNQSLVSRRTEDDVGVLGVGSDLGYPATVAFEGSAELKGLSHFGFKDQSFVLH